MHTIIHGNLFSTFIAQQPERIPLGTEYENDLWNSFWSFLKSKTNLTLYEIQELSDFDEIMLAQLSTGRGDTIIKYEERPFSAYKYKVKCDEPLTFFCIKEESEIIRKKYRKKNGYIFAFREDLMETWDKLSLLSLKCIHPIRKNVQVDDGFMSWSKLGDYLTPFTDAVFIDNYIFNDPSLIPSNLEQILVELDRATPVKYNLTILTFHGADNKVNGQQSYDVLKEIKQRNSLKCNIELVLAPRMLKEHDRQIITNYIRVKSGDSFNYFNSRGEIVTRGTEISFGSLVNEVERDVAMCTLGYVAEKIDEIKERHSNSVFGECNNMLLSGTKKLVDNGL